MTALAGKKKISAILSLAWKLYQEGRILDDPAWGGVVYAGKEKTTRQGGFFRGSVNRQVSEPW